MSSAEIVFEKIQERFETNYDLIITQFGGRTGEAHKVLRELKRLQLQQMDSEYSISPSEGEKGKFFASSSKFTSLPAVLVCGMNYYFEERKNQLTRLGALDYCGWSDDYFVGTLSAYDLIFFAALYRAFSRKQEY